jgi:hypothetical protein
MLEVYPAALGQPQARALGLGRFVQIHGAHVGHHPEPGEVGDLHQELPGLHRCPLGHLALHHGAGKGRANLQPVPAPGLALPTPLVQPEPGPGGLKRGLVALDLVLGLVHLEPGHGACLEHFPKLIPPKLRELERLPGVHNSDLKLRQIRPAEKNRFHRHQHLIRLDPGAHSQVL